MVRLYVTSTSPPTECLHFLGLLKTLYYLQLCNPILERILECRVTGDLIALFVEQLIGLTSAPSALMK